jgi:hypothetical protein
VYIQPIIGGAQELRQQDYECLDGSPEQLIADELGVSCPPSVRDPWHIEQEPGWASGAIANAGTELTSPNGFQALLGLSPGDVQGLPAGQREGAFRWDGRFASESFGVLPDAGDDWNDELGELELHDRYFIADNTELISGGVFRRNQPAHCAKFLRSVMHVETFVTDAPLDTTVRTPAIVDALVDCSIVLDAPDFVDDPLAGIDVDRETQSGVERPGWLLISFNDLSEVGATTRSVRFPEYEASGHAVHFTEPVELRDDVRVFLSDTGLDL